MPLVLVPVRPFASGTAFRDPDMDFIPRTPLSHLRYGRVFLDRQLPFILEVQFAAIVTQQRPEELRDLDGYALESKVRKAICQEPLQKAGLVHQVVIEEGEVESRVHQRSDIRQENDAHDLPIPPDFPRQIHRVTH